MARSAAIAVLAVAAAATVAVARPNAAASLTAHGAPAELVADEVLSLPWGDGNREVGLREAPEGAYGPQAISVDEERRRVHLLDSVNRRILTVGFDGTLVAAAPAPALAEDLAALPDGTFLVLVPATSTVECVVPGGRSCGRTLLAGAAAARGFRRLARDVTVLWRPDNTVIRLMSAGGAGFSATAGATLPAPEASPVVLRRTVAGGAEIESAPAAGTVRLRASVARRCGPVESLTPVGRDDDDTLYLVVEERCGDRIARFLEAFSADGAPVAAAELPWSTRAFVYRDLDLAPGGRAYQLLARSEGVAVLRWSVRTEPSQTAAAPSDGPPARPLLAVAAVSRDAPQLPPGASAVAEAGIAPSATVSQQEVMARARAYADHSFTPGPDNVTGPTGEFCGGKLVKTPEWLSVGETTTGVPYKWGGLTALADWGQSPDDQDCAGTGRTLFDDGLLAGRLAGDTCASSCSGMYCGSHCTVGVDCSGYVSRLWGLPSHVTTSALPASPYACPTALRSFDHLVAGDVLNRAGSHMRLFVARDASGNVEVLEASGRDWKVAPHSYHVGELAAYLPYRKRAIAGMFAVGERVVAGDDGVDVRPCTDLGAADCAPVGQAVREQPGTIAAGPEERGGYLWWSVAWDGGPSGWTAQCSLAKSDDPGPQPCEVTLTPAGAAFAWGAASGTFAVAAEAGCAWTATTAAPWIRLEDGAGTGSGTVRFSLDANTSPTLRTGTIAVSGRSFSVTQVGLRLPRARLRSAATAARRGGR